MKKYLHFICPTDYLESVISEAFSGEHYFFTSLGNSMTFDKEMVGQITELLEIKQIEEISFVLSDDNRILLDAVGNQDLWEVEGLVDFYAQIIGEKETSGELWQADNQQFLLSSYHLNNKIRELKTELEDRLLDQLKICAKIYQRQEKQFRNIYPEIILREFSGLN